MSLNFLRAHFACDECGTQFSVEMEATYQPPNSWSLFDCAVDAVRGSNGYEEARNKYILGFSSVEGDKHLCAACTEKADAKEQTGEQNAAPQAGQRASAAPSQEGHAAGPAVAAPDAKKERP